jgi:protein ImuB
MSRLGYLFLPRFPMQRRVIEQPSLAGKPVVLHADERGAQRVRFASGRALKRGIRPGLSVAAASALEPSCVRLRYDEQAEALALRSLGEAMLPLAPGFQVDDAEGLWLDASAAALFGGEGAWATRVIDAARVLGLSGRCVVAQERFTAQAVARHRGEPTVVGPRGGGVLAPLPLSALERGWLGPDAAAPFRSLGLSTLGELAGLASGALVARFGATGLQAARLCRGEDDSRFVADELPEVIDEAVQLDWPAEHLEPVLFALKMAIDRVCARLQGRQQAAVRVQVTVRLDGAEPLVVPLVLARPSSEGRMLLELARHRLTDLTVHQPIVAIAVRIDEASADPGRQLVLGDAPAGEAALEIVLSRLQSALGEASLFAAAPRATHRPEAAWEQRRFAPPVSATGYDWLVPPRAEAAVSAVEEQVEPVAALLDVPAALELEAAAVGEGAPVKRWPRRKAKVEQVPLVCLPSVSTRPPRVFKEPSRLHAEVTEAGALTWVNVAGRRRKVESIWGPERLVGAWWEEGYARDYYRVQLEGVGLLWIFRDGRDGAFYAQGVFD